MHNLLLNGHRPILRLLALSILTCGVTMSAMDNRPLQAGPGGADLGNGTYQNPVLSGNWPDPSIIRDGADYYLVHSSGDTTPGLPVWHSQDLVNWEPYGHALTRHGGDIWAPDIVKRGDLFYIYYCAGGGNYVVTAKNPRGPWSPPIDLKTGGIDPARVDSLDGSRSWLFLDNGMVADLAPDGLSVLSKRRKIFDPWPIPADWPIEGICLEGPKIRVKDGWYYMLVAQGGTAGPPASHMVLAARSKAPEGPWEWAPKNPILRTTSPDEPWWSMGHGSLIDSPDGKWWLVFHAYRKDFHTLGRSTLVLPIAWTADGWPEIPAGTNIAAALPIPKGAKVPGLLEYSDAFPGNKLGPAWNIPGKNPGENRVNVMGGHLTLTAHGTTLNDTQPILLSASHTAYSIEVDVEPQPGVEAGLTLYYGPNVGLGFSLFKQELLIRWQHRIWSHHPVGTNHLRLRMTNNRHTVGYEYSADGGKAWTRIPVWHEVSGFNHNTFGGFATLRPGLFAAGAGTATFADFRYVPLR